MQTALNALLGRTASHPLITTFVVFTIGGTACFLGLLVIQPVYPEFSAWQSVPPVAWLGGLIALIYVVLLVLF